MDKGRTEGERNYLYDYEKKIERGKGRGKKSDTRERMLRGKSI